MVAWTLQRYIFREMGRAFFLTALALTAVLSMGGGVLNMIHVEELSARQLLKLMALTIPVAASLTLPIAAMFSAAATYGRIAADNEFVACRGSGINIQVLLLPALIISLATGIVTFFCINSVIPQLVQNLDRIVGRDLRSLVAQRLRQPSGSIPGLKRYRMYWDQAPPVPKGMDDGFVLRGVAFVEMNDESAVRIGTAREVWIRVRQDDGRATVSGEMRDLSYYEPATGQFYQSGAMTLYPNEIPFTVPMKLKFLDLGALVDLRRHPQDWHEVRDLVDALRVGVGRAMTRRHLLDLLSKHGAFQLDGARQSYRLETTVPTFVERDGSLSWQPPRDAGATPVVVIETRDGRQRRLTAGRATLELGRGDTLEESRITIRLFDDVVMPDFADPARSLTVNDVALPPIELPASVVADVGGMSDEDLLSVSGTIADDPLLPRQRAQVLSRLGMTVRKITGVIHQRLAFTASVFVLVTLAAVLGIILRHAQLLTAFGISFVPSLLVIVTIVAGRQLAEKPDTLAAGLAVMWSGLALVAAGDTWLLTRVLRR